MKSNLPEGWIEEPLSEVIEPRGEKVSPQDFPDLKFIGMDHVESQTTRIIGSVPASSMKSNAARFYESDVLYGRLRPYLNKVTQPSFDGLASAEFIVFADTPLIKSDFLKYRLNAADFVSFAGHLNEGDRPRVGFDQIGTFKMRVPPPREQKRIVAKIEELFSELDKGIESLKTARAQLKIYRQSVLKHAFEGKLTERWREENKEKLEDVSECLKKLDPPQQPRGGRAASESVIEGRAAISVNRPKKVPPDGWQWVPLLRVARQETGHTPSRKFSHYWDGGKIPWIGIADARIHHGKIINETIQKPTEEGIKNSSARLLPKYTVCLSRTASVGYICVMGNEMATSQDFATWTCTALLNPYFLMYALMAEGGHIKKFGKGTTHTTIYFPEIRAFNICLPPISEQKEIVAQVEKQFSMIEATEIAIDEQLQKAEALRQSILKQAFSGKLVAQDPNDEPAAALLERIKAEKQKSSKTKKRAA